IYEKNAHEKRPPASLTKIMTSLLLLENVADLDGTTTTAPGYIFDELYGLNVSTADIWPYEEVSARSLLYAMLLPSGNEAASIAADLVGGGSMANFTALMTARAQQLGATETNFTNPHGIFGIEKNHYSTAYDMYLIAKECWYSTNPAVQNAFREAASATEYWMPLSNKHKVPMAGAPAGKAYAIRTTNTLMRFGSPYYMPEVQGIKTGSTPDAGYNLISTATKNGETYMLVVMGTPYETDADGYGLAFPVSKQLYDWAFGNFSVRPALDTTKDITEIKVKYSSETDTLMLRPASDLMTLLPNESDETTVNKTFKLPESVSAPIAAGDVVGTVTLSLAGEEIGTVDLVAAVSVERNTALYVVAKVGEFFSSLYFKVLAILIGITLCIYFVYITKVNHDNKKRRKVKRTSRRF
ncbi:MAG: hypothetical protein RR075_00555, partial [Pygmaiobacter sp.]